MRQMTIDEEIPVTKDGLIIYRNEIIKELDKRESVVRRLKTVLNKCDDILEKMNK